MKKIPLTLALAAALTLGAVGLASAETPVSRTYMDSLIRAERQDQNFRRPPVRHYGSGPAMPQAQQPEPEAKPEARTPQNFQNPQQDFKAPSQPPRDCPPPKFRGNPPRTECAENAPAPGIQPPENCPPPDFRGGPRQEPPPAFRGEHCKDFRRRPDKEFRGERHRERRDEFRGRHRECRDFRPPRECRCED